MKWDWKRGNHIKQLIMETAGGERNEERVRGIPRGLEVNSVTLNPCLRLNACITGEEGVTC